MWTYGDLMGETLSEIQSWVKKQEIPEDPISRKSEHRVTRAMAENLKHTEKCPTGKCSLCSVDSERLSPISMKICGNCCTNFLTKGYQFTAVKEFGSHFCDSCFAHTLQPYKVNPIICDKCIQKLGNTHKHRRDELDHNKQRIDKIKKEKYNIYGNRED